MLQWLCFYEQHILNTKILRRNFTVGYGTTPAACLYYTHRGFLPKIQMSLVLALLTKTYAMGAFWHFVVPPVHKEKQLYTQQMAESQLALPLAMLHGHLP